MPRNKMTDLNNHLFEQLERLNDEEITGDDLKTEIQRAKAISSVSHAIIANAQVMLEARKHIDEYGLSPDSMGNILMIEDKK